VAAVQEETEQRMHSVAESLLAGDTVHERANELSDKAREHERTARALRQDPD